MSSIILSIEPPPYDQTPPPPKPTPKGRPPQPPNISGTQIPRSQIGKEGHIATDFHASRSTPPNEPRPLRPQTAALEKLSPNPPLPTPPYSTPLSNPSINISEPVLSFPLTAASRSPAQISSSVLHLTRNTPPPSSERLPRLLQPTKARCAMLKEKAPLPHPIPALAPHLDFRPLKYVDGHVFHGFPSSEVPYPQTYDSAVLDAQTDTHRLLIILTDGNPSFYQWQEGRTPDKVLDVGCGTGDWVRAASKCWRGSGFAGFDIAPVQLEHQSQLSEPRLEPGNSNVRWLHGNLLEGLPFHSGTMDFIRLSYMSLAVPCSCWPQVISECQRVLSNDGVLEIIDENPTVLHKIHEYEEDHLVTNANSTYVSYLSNHHLDEMRNVVSPLLDKRFHEPIEHRQYTLELPDAEYCVSGGIPEPVSPPQKRDRKLYQITPYRPSTRGYDTPVSISPGLLIDENTLIRLSPQQLLRHVTASLQPILAASPFIAPSNAPSLNLDTVEYLRTSLQTFEKERYIRFGLPRPEEIPLESSGENSKLVFVEKRKKGGLFSFARKEVVTSEDEGDGRKKPWFKRVPTTEVRRIHVWIARRPKRF